MLTVRTSENTVITSFRLISERQDFSSVRTGENTVRARARIHSLNPKNCIKSRPLQTTAGNCTFQEDQRRNNDAKINEMIGKVAKNFSSVTVVDASKAICDQGICFVGDGVNSIYYHDDNHLTNKGSDLVLSKILQQGKF